MEYKQDAHFVFVQVRIENKMDYIRFATQISVTLIATATSAEERWINLGEKPDFGYFFLDATSVEKVPNGEFSAISFLSFTYPYIDEDMGEIGSVVELNLYDCSRDVIFALSTMYYSGQDPRVEGSGFINKITPTEILGFPPEDAFLLFRHPVHDYICNNY